jgi:hypothetical protein
LGRCEIVLVVRGSGRGAILLGVWLRSGRHRVWCILRGSSLDVEDVVYMNAKHGLKRGASYAFVVATSCSEELKKA